MKGLPVNQPGPLTPCMQKIIQTSEEADAREIGKDLFNTLARSEEVRNTMAETMRNTVIAM